MVIQRSLWNSLSIVLLHSIDVFLNAYEIIIYNAATHQVRIQGWQGAIAPTPSPWTRPHR